MRTVQELTQLQEQYAELHPAPCDPHRVYSIADEYIKTEKVTTIQNADDALRYIQGAIHYIKFEALEAEKFPENSDERWKIDGRIVRMMSCISACAHYLLKEHPSLVQRSPGIEWEALSQFLRIEQYNPSFISGVGYREKASLIRSLLHQIGLGDELETLKTSCGLLQQDKQFRQNDRLIPNFLRLSGFFNDEYLAGYVEEGITNWRENRGIENVSGKAKLLRSIMIIGEALNFVSPVLLNKFNPDLVRRFCDARIVLCHPERPANRTSLENILLRNGDALQVNGENISLAQFDEDILLIDNIAKDHLQLYKVPNPNILDITNYGNDATWNQELANRQNDARIRAFPDIKNQYEIQINRANNDAEKQALKLQMNRDIENRLNHLNEIRPVYRTDAQIDEIKEIKYHQIENERSNNVTNLQTELMQWVNANYTTEKSKLDAKSKLGEPDKEVGKMQAVLNQNKDQYQVAKNKSDNGQSISKEEQKLLIDYPNLLAKLEKWSEYAKQKNELETNAHNQKDTVDAEHQTNLRFKTVSLIDFCLEQTRKVEQFFESLNNQNRLQNQNWAGRVDNQYTLRGFGSQPDHHTLEFHQIMVGSVARSLLENQKFMDKAPDELKEILEKTAKPSRGYLAHIGVRQGGRNFKESQDRPQVFQENSEQLIKAIPMLRAVSHAIERNTSYDEALRNTQAIVAYRG